MGYALDKAETTTRVVMNRKQTVLAFIAFFITLAVITMPLWADHAMPHLNSYLRAVVETAGRWVDVLKGLLGSE